MPRVGTFRVEFTIAEEYVTVRFWLLEPPVYVKVTPPEWVDRYLL